MKMEYDDKSTNCVVVTCRVEAKEALGGVMHGFYMCAMDSWDIKYDGALFSRDPIDTEAPFASLYAMLEAPRAEGREEMERYENGLKDYVRTSRLLQGWKNLSDPKGLEHKVTYFCTSVMSLNVISFLEVTEMSQDEFYLVIPSLEYKNKQENSEKPAEEGETSADESQDAVVPDVVISCDPVLDPVLGVAVGELSVGDIICCKLREDSVFFDLMVNALPNFNGVISGDIIAIQASEMGSIVISLKLSDGVVGAIKLAESVRLKVLSRKALSETNVRKSLLRFDALLAIAGIVVFLFMMWLLLRFLP
ncbi:MAG: hypothetical protein LBU13_03335 [Synergistaceae bacterium]|jgi:hypothetical protein|nr:hypothetical protein [Synergistaceae bacterium]